MKSFHGYLSLIGLLIIANGISAQTLFTYGNKAVSKEEFLKAYNKNNTADKRDEKALRDYLDLYTKFKLKVQAAYDRRMDTLPAQRAELQSFRAQLVQNYMNDEASMQDLVNEAFERSQKDIRIAHIFIPATDKDSASVIQKATQKAQQAYQQLQAGKDFGEVALAYSADPSVKRNRGDIGYITVFSLPYQLETLAYNTPLGKFSAPYRSKAGYHIFMRTGERRPIGKIKIAQILLTFPPDTGEHVREEYKRRADSLYQLAIKGEDFGRLAAEFSADNFSFQTKGELPEFGAGRFDSAFEAKAFGLKKDGEISNPFLSEYGYHIVKRISHTDIPTNRKDKDYLEKLHQQVANDDRMDVSRRAMHQKIMRLIGYKKATFNEKDLWAYTDSVFYKRPVPSATSIRPNTVLFSFAKQRHTTKDWIEFRKTVNAPDHLPNVNPNLPLFENYVDVSANEYYREHLHEYNKDFAFQLKEFKDGNLLFEIMQQNVWDKAAGDSVGLKKYFHDHRDKYWWSNSVTGILFTAPHDSTAKSLLQKLQDNIDNWKKIVESYDGNVIADSSRFEVEQIPLAANTPIHINSFSPFIRNQADSNISFIYILQHYPQRSPRNFEEARGYVINDYQVFLENEWIAELKKKYPIKINETVFQSLLK